MSLNTKHFEDNKEIQNIDTFIAFLTENSVEFKVKVIDEKKNYKVLIVNNDEVSKITSGIGYDRGKQKLYYMGTDIIYISNSFGWNGVGEPYSTHNFIKILSGNQAETKFDNLLGLDSSSNSLTDIDTDIKSIYGIKTVSKLYDDMEDFIEKNPKLFNKYFSNMFDSNMFININEILGMLGSDIIPQTKNYKRKSEFVEDSIKLEDAIGKVKDFYKKVNLKIKLKETRPNLKRIQVVYEQNENVIDTKLSFLRYENIEKSDINYYMFILVNPTEKDLLSYQEKQNDFNKFLNESEWESMF